MKRLFIAFTMVATATLFACSSNTATEEGTEETTESMGTVEEEATEEEAAPEEADSMEATEEAANEEAATEEAATEEEATEEAE